MGPKIITPKAVSSELKVLNVIDVAFRASNGAVAVEKGQPEIQHMMCFGGQGRSWIVAKIMDAVCTRNTAALSF